MHLMVSYNWLKEYLRTKKTAKEFAAEISLKGPTVDHIIETQAGFSGVVVGKILEINRHPDADKLQVTKVEVGKAGGILTIVCGAANIAVGQKVPVALIGAMLPGEFKIAKREMRGVVSQGMLCSAKELQFGEDHSGILILAEDSIVGLPLEKVLPVNDAVLDFEITSNRPDAMSVVGLAREASAILAEKFLYREPKVDLKLTTKALPLHLEIKEPQLCPRYQAVVLSGVRVAPSPLWLQQRLIASGLRPINNLVDITNYVLLEYGQPLHVFDYDKLVGHKIIVRQAKAGEKILALDGKTYELNAPQLVIADEQQPVAVAGVMGGELSSAQVTTKQVVIEAANFSAVSVRKTARALNLHSEASDLFEKSLSPSGTYPAILRAIELIIKLADGQVASEIFDQGKKIAAPEVIKLSLATVDKYLGVKISPIQIKKILVSLGFVVSGNSKEISVTAPAWRAAEIEGEHDLIEEIARIYGYQNLPTHTPLGEVPAWPVEISFYWENIIKNCLAGLGFWEIYSYSLVSEKSLKSLGLATTDCLAVVNPLSSEYQYLRTSLLPSLLKVVGDNQDNFASQHLFELANIYQPQLNDLPQEELTLALVQTGLEAAKTFFDLKGSLTVLFDKLGVVAEYKNFTGENFWHPARSAEILVAGVVVGKLGEIRPEAKANYDLKQPIVAAQLNLTALIKLARLYKTYIPLPKFPAMVLDLSVVLAKQVSWQELAQTVKGVNKLIQAVELFDVYQGANIPEGKKSVAFSVTYRHPERTLKSEEVDNIQTEIIKLLREKFNGEIRQ
ncbi:MAG: phenylalanine--tRNA ligase subunit beta [Candidatus Buchananbacteria bacterium]